MLSHSTFEHTFAKDAMLVGSATFSAELRIDSTGSTSGYSGNSNNGSDDSDDSDGSGSASGSSDASGKFRGAGLAVSIFYDPPNAPVGYQGWFVTQGFGYFDHLNSNDTR
jgi:hypothetical protein